MAEIKLAEKNFSKDADFAKALHGKDAGKKAGIVNFLSKDHKAQEAASEGYFKHWDIKDGHKTENDDVKKGRVEDYSDMTKHYYNLATDFYEYGWGSSFHFCRFYPGEAFQQAIARHQHYLALKLGLSDGMKVLDVGCGVGGPALEIARFSGAHVTGLNNNDYQIKRAQARAEKAGLSDQLSFVKGDFMQMDFPDNSFDAVYAIEATCHAPELAGVYGEMYRVLKPGGKIAFYEWVMTDDYDPENSKHREISYGIEVGSGLPKVFKRQHAIDALEKVGFKIDYAKDLADPKAEWPWYYILTGELKYATNLINAITCFRSSKLGRRITMEFATVMETIGLAPKGTRKIADMLEYAAVYCVEGGKQGLFTPMMLFVCTKPE